MSEQTSDADYPAGTRAVAQYVGHEGADPDVEVSLPGYLGAVPSIVKPGESFTVDAAFADELDASGEFEVEGILDPESAADRALVSELEQHVTQVVVPAELAEADAARVNVADLRGDALAEAAKAAGVPSSLSAAEKRAALAENPPVVTQGDPGSTANPDAVTVTDPQE